MAPTTEAKSAPTAALKPGKQTRRAKAITEAIVAYSMAVVPELFDWKRRASLSRDIADLVSFAHKGAWRNERLQPLCRERYGAPYPIWDGRDKAKLEQGSGELVKNVGRGTKLLHGRDNDERDAAGDC